MSHGSIHCFGHFPSFFVCLPEATPWQERSDEDRPLDFQAPASLQGREQLSGKGHWMLDDGCHFLPKTDEKCPVWWCLMMFDVASWNSNFISLGILEILCILMVVSFSPRVSFLFPWPAATSNDNFAWSIWLATLQRCVKTCLFFFSDLSLELL